MGGGTQAIRHPVRRPAAAGFPVPALGNLAMAGFPVPVLGDPAMGFPKALRSNAIHGEGFREENEATVAR